MRTSKTSGSLNWCHPMHLVMHQASFFPQNQQPVGPAAAPNGPEFSGSTGTTSLYPSLNGTTSVATPQILPPDYSTSDYPKGQLPHNLPLLL